MGVSHDVDAGEWTAINEVVTRLTQTFPEVPADKVKTVVHHNHARFDGRPVRDFVPLFVERGARRELSQLGG
jgi:hypothetical protein